MLHISRYGKYLVLSSLVMVLIIIINGFIHQIGHNEIRNNDTFLIDEDLSSCLTKQKRRHHERFKAELNESYIRPIFDKQQTFDVLNDNVQECLYLKDESDSFKNAEYMKYTKSSTGNKKVRDNDGRKRMIYSVLSEFNNVLASMNLKAVIIEPSMLYCMLKSTHQDLLLKRKFKASGYLGSKKIVTYGIFGSHVSILQKEENFYKFKESGFQPHFVQMPLEDWTRSESMLLHPDSFTSHIFYFHQNCTIHLVVFVERNNFLWHSALQSQGLIIPPQSDLLFVNHDAAYEKFMFVPLQNKVENSTEFFIPSDPHYFLFQMMSSRFIECDMSRAANVLTRKQPNTHAKLSVKSFNERAVLAIREIKTVFHPLLMNVWAASGTLLGWYRQCDIIPYTTDIDFGSWSFEIENLKTIMHSLSNNKNLQIVMRMGLLEEALEFQLNCHDLRVDLFFMYPLHNGSWSSIHSPREGFYARQYYPHFTLCSAELLGEKIQVPCEANNMILVEYGPEWKEPVSVWGYLSSIKNRGPLIYWNKSTIKNVYETF